jgi:hypothetical protein
MPVTALCTLADVKAGLNDFTGTTGNDAELQDFIDGMTEVVQYLVGPVIPTSFTEQHDGGAPHVLLHHGPVLSVTSVDEWDGRIHYTITQQDLNVATTFDGYGFTVNLETGVLTRRSSGMQCRFAPGVQNIIVTYQAGRASVPPSIKRATVELVRINYQQTQQGGAPKYGQTSAYDDTVDATSVMGYLVPNRVMEMLMAQKRPGGLA